MSASESLQARRAVGVLALICLLSACSRESHLSSLSGSTMGTSWSLRAVDPPPAFQALIQAHLDSREAIFSHWRADSALSRFNASPAGEWFPVPPELVRAVETAKAISDETEGALAVTLAPLIDLWGFGGSLRTSDTVPSQEQIDRALDSSGWHLLQWRHDPPALRKANGALRINLASIAEGIVMDELVDLIRQCDLQDFLLEVGGEVAAIGHAPDGGPWRVGIQTPGAPDGQVMQTLALANQCLATSGTYRHRFEADGRTFSHLIDPRTGWPVAHSLASVSVVDSNCTRADGFATALLILGPVKGREIAQRLGLRVFWIETEADE